MNDTPGDSPFIFDVTSTSAQSADVADIPFHLTSSDNANSTRKVMRYKLVKNPNNPDENVKIKILHQRRHKGEPNWKDQSHFNLRNIKGGEEVQMQLNSQETLTLFKRLSELYALRGQG